MTLYLVKYSDSDFRLCREDGTEIDSFSSDPRENAEGEPKNPIPDFVDSVAKKHGGASILKDRNARRDHAKILTGDWCFRDVEEHGESEVPW